VNDANAPFFCQGNGQSGLGHRVHGSRDDRQVEPEVSRELAGELGVFGEDRRMRWHEQHIVEGQGFLKDSHV